MKNKESAIAALRAKLDALYAELDEISGEGEAVTYSIEFEYLDSVVVARMYEVSGEERHEIAKGHGHIIHAGALGIAQAASYALKRIYGDLEEA